MTIIHFNSCYLSKVAALLYVTLLSNEKVWFRESK